MNYWDSWKNNHEHYNHHDSNNINGWNQRNGSDKPEPDPTSYLGFCWFSFFLSSVNGIWFKYVFSPCWCCCLYQLFVVSGCVVLCFVVCLEIIVSKYRNEMKWLCCWRRKKREKRKENSYKKSPFLIYFIKFFEKFN